MKLGNEAGNKLEPVEEINLIFGCSCSVIIIR